MPKRSDLSSTFEEAAKKSWSPTQSIGPDKPVNIKSPFGEEPKKDKPWSPAQP